MAQSKNLNMLLMDGTANGRIKCTISNWIGVAFKIPRDKIESCKNRDELKQSGIYFLLGENEVYIGQAGSRKNGEGILNRLLEHKRNPDKNYWNEAVIFTTSNNFLGSTEISFLENKFCNLAINAKRCEVKNSNDPSPGNITEEKEIELEEFADYVKIVMSIFGYNIFEPLAEKNIYTDEENLFYLERNLKTINFKVKAVGKPVENGFIVLAGSQISPELDSNLRENVKKARITSKISDENILLEDTFLGSPTAAARFVTGRQIQHAPGSWINSNGISLYEFLKHNEIKEKNQ